MSDDPEYITLDDGERVALYWARFTTLTLEYLLASHGGANIVENLKAICHGEIRRFAGADAGDVEHWCVKFGILKGGNGTLVPAHDDVCTVIRSIVRGSGHSMKIVIPRELQAIADEWQREDEEKQN